MSTIIELLPKVVSEGRREANRILEGISNSSRISLQTNELVSPNKDRAQRTFGAMTQIMGTPPPQKRLILRMTTGLTA